MNDQTKLYQLTYLIRPLSDEKGLVEISQKIKKWIEEKQGQIEEEKTTNRGLAYSIQKYQQAVYSNLSFQMFPESIQELQEYLKLEGNILRYIIQKKPVLRLSRKRIKPTPLKTEASRAQQEFDLSGQTFKKHTLGNKQDLDKLAKKESLEKPSHSLPQKEKVKLEELDKKLDEILNE